MLSSIAALLFTEGCLFSGKVSSLDAFRSYPKQLSGSACPVGQLINQRLRCPVPLVLWATSPQTTTPLSGRDRPVSRRSKPSSRSPLMGEQPHPWLLLQNQDGKSRLSPLNLVSLEIQSDWLMALPSSAEFCPA